jgi:hypothetical protein
MGETRMTTATSQLVAPLSVSWKVPDAPGPANPVLTLTLTSFASRAYRREDVNALPAPVADNAATNIATLVFVYSPAEWNALLPLPKEGLAVTANTLIGEGFPLLAEGAELGISSAEAVTSREYVDTLSRIEEFRGEQEVEDQPSDYAYASARRILQRAAQDLRMHFPRASTSVGPGRGLRLAWPYGAREVRLFCAGRPESKSYVYWESREGHGVELDVNGSTLARFLRWVIQAA